MDLRDALSPFWSINVLWRDLVPQSTSGLDPSLTL